MKWFSVKYELIDDQCSINYLVSIIIKKDVDHINYQRLGVFKMNVIWYSVSCSFNPIWLKDNNYSIFNKYDNVENVQCTY